MPNLRKRKRALTEKSPASGSKGAATRRSKMKTSPASTSGGLNYDTLHAVFTFLSDLDLFHCERVCRTWRDTARDWMTCNFRSKFPHAWETHQPDHLTSEFYKQQAQLQRNVHAGTPSSVRQVAKCNTLVFAGSFIAWTMAGETPGWVNWQNLERSKGGGSGEILIYLSKNYLKAPNHAVYVINFALNREGILLLRLEAPEYRTGRSKRILALSPEPEVPKSKGIISNEASERDWIKRGLIPLLIGIRRIYFARRDVESDSYDLVAHDFRTGKLAYETPVLAKTWTMGDVSSIDSDFRKTQVFYKLVQSHEDKEFILELSSQDTAKKPCISIFNGADGQFVQKLDFPEASLSCVMLHANSSFNSVVFQSTISSGHPRDVNSLQEVSHTTMIRRFSWNSQGCLAASSVDVVCTGQAPDNIVKPAIHPFSMVAVSNNRINEWRFPSDTELGGSYVLLKFYGQPLLKTMEDRFLDLANATIDSWFPSDPPTLGHCFIEGEETAVTLPKRPEIGRNERAPMSVTGSYFRHWNMFLGGRYVLSGQGSGNWLPDYPNYLLDFME